MNALLWTPSSNDDAVLWLCVKHPPQTLSGVARALGKKVGTVCQNVQKLRSHGYLDSARASMVPNPVAIERVRWLERKGFHWPHQSPATPAPVNPLARPTESLSRSNVGAGVALIPEDGLESVRCKGCGEPAGSLWDGEYCSRPCQRKAMEPRGSISEPPVDRLIDALAGFQDELLQKANAQLRLRVSELEAEVADLRDQRARALLLTASVADALTG